MGGDADADDEPTLGGLASAGRARRGAELDAEGAAADVRAGWRRMARHDRGKGVAARGDALGMAGERGDDAGGPRELEAAANLLRAPRTRVTVATRAEAREAIDAGARPGVREGGSRRTSRRDEYISSRDEPSSSERHLAVSPHTSMSRALASPRLARASPGRASRRARRRARSAPAPPRRARSRRGSGRVRLRLGRRDHGRLRSGRHDGRRRRRDRGVHGGVDAPRRAPARVRARVLHRPLPRVVRGAHPRQEGRHGDARRARVRGGHEGVPPRARFGSPAPRVARVGGGPRVDRAPSTAGGTSTPSSRSRATRSRRARRGRRRTSARARSSRRTRSRSARGTRWSRRSSRTSPRGAPRKTST